MKKKAGFYYAIVLAFGLLVALCTSMATQRFRETISILFGHKPLPPLTTYVVNCSWWPWAILGLATVGILLSFREKIDDTHLCHGALLLALLSALCATVSLLGYAVLFYSPMWKLAP